MVRHRHTTWFRILLPAIFLLPCLAGCGGGGGGDPQVAPSISRAAAYPGEFVSVFHPSISGGSAASVTFTGPDGYRMELAVEDTASGTARVAVPVCLDPVTGRSAAGDYQVQVNGLAVSGSFTIRELPELGTDPGEVYARLLEGTLDSYRSVLTHLAQIERDQGTDMSAAAAEVNQRVAIVEAMVTEIRDQGQLTLTLNPGERVVLGQAELATLDQWLAAWVLGMETELGVRGGRRAADSPFENWGTTSAEERLQAIQDSIDESVRGFKRGLEGGKVLVGGMTLAFAGAGMLVGGPAGAAVGAAAGLALAYFSAGYELGSAAIYDRVCESFSEGSREAYDFGSQVMGQIGRIAAAGAAGIEGLAGSLFSLISSGTTLLDTMDAAENMRCDPPAERTMRAAGNLLDGFCGDGGGTLPGDLIQDLFSAQVSIPDAGYSRFFEPAQVEAGFATISDGGDQIIMDGIPTMVGTDSLPGAEPGDYAATLLLYVHPNLALSGAPPWELPVSDELELFEGAEAQMVFWTPSIRHQTPLNDPVMFGASAGTVSLEVYGNGDGELFKGTFSVTLSGERGHWDEASQTVTREPLSGTATGSFDGVLSMEAGQ